MGTSASTTVATGDGTSPVATAELHRSAHPGEPQARVCVHVWGATWRFDAYPHGLEPSRLVGNATTEAIDAGDVPRWCERVLIKAGYEISR